MPIIKSAIKRVRQAATRRQRNLQVKRAVKHDIQAVQTAITAGQAADMQSTLRDAYSEIDRAVKKGTLHANTAARRKSRLAHQVAQAIGAETVKETKTTKGASAKKAPAKKAVASKTTTKTTAAKKPAAKTSKSKAE